MAVRAHTSVSMDACITQLLEGLGINPGQKYEVQYVHNQWLSDASRVGTGVHQLFVKSLPKDRLRQQVFRSPAFFNNEAAFYGTTLPALLGFQERRLGAAGAGFQCAPRCYLARPDLIALQDMAGFGFVPPDSRALLSLQQLHLLMRELGRFHALSLAMKDQAPEAFRSAVGALRETIWIDEFATTFGRRLYGATSAASLDWVRESTQNQGTYADKLHKLVVDFESIMRNQVRAHADNPLNVVTHGDVWASNFLFKNGAEALCFIDFQQSRYASLALDVSSVLFMNTDKTVRADHRNALLRSYHDSLSEMMEALGSDPKRIFPFAALEEQLGKFSLFALITAFLNVPHAMNERDTGVEELKLLSVLGDQPLGVQQTVDVIQPIMAQTLVHATPQCKERICDVLKDAVDRGYLDHL